MQCNLYQTIFTKLPLNQRLIDGILEQTAEILKIRKQWEITVLIVGDRKMKSLNKKYKNKYALTDVLAFSQQEGDKIVLPVSKVVYLGDIVICYPQAKRQAKIYQQSVAKELSLLVIHGILHLLGYDDLNPEAAGRMNKLQQQILAKIYG